MNRDEMVALLEGGAEIQHNAGTPPEERAIMRDLAAEGLVSKDYVAGHDNFGAWSFKWLGEITDQPALPPPAEEIVKALETLRQSCNDLRFRAFCENLTSYRQSGPEARDWLDDLYSAIGNASC